MCSRAKMTYRATKWPATTNNDAAHSCSKLDELMDAGDSVSSSSRCETIRLPYRSSAVQLGRANNRQLLGCLEHNPMIDLILLESMVIPPVRHTPPVDQSSNYWNKQGAYTVLWSSHCLGYFKAIFVIFWDSLDYFFRVKNYTFLEFDDVET